MSRDQELGPKELDALDDLRFERIDRKIVILPENPRPTGCEKLKGYKNTWRVRAGNWRVVSPLTNPPLS